MKKRLMFLLLFIMSCVLFTTSHSEATIVEVHDGEESLTFVPTMDRIVEATLVYTPGYFDFEVIGTNPSQSDIERSVKFDEARLIYDYENPYTLDEEYTYRDDFTICEVQLQREDAMYYYCQAEIVLNSSAKQESVDNLKIKKATFGIVEQNTDLYYNGHQQNIENCISVYSDMVIPIPSQYFYVVCRESDVVAAQTYHYCIYVKDEYSNLFQDGATKQGTISVEPLHILSSDIRCEVSNSLQYEGNGIPLPEVTLTRISTGESLDYIRTYLLQSPDNAKMSFEGTGNYTFEKDFFYQVEKADLSRNTEIVFLEDPKMEGPISFIVKHKGNTLDSNADYNTKIVKDEATNTVTITITGENYCMGFCVLQYPIIPPIGDMTETQTETNPTKSGSTVESGSSPVLPNDIPDTITTSSTQIKVSQIKKGNEMRVTTITTDPNGETKTKTYRIKIPYITYKKSKITFRKTTGYIECQLKKYVGLKYKRIKKYIGSSKKQKKYKLSPRYRYQVCYRSYRIINGKKYYSDWVKKTLRRNERSITMKFK